MPTLAHILIYTSFFYIASSLPAPPDISNLRDTTTFTYPLPHHNLSLIYTIPNPSLTTRLNPLGLQRCAGRASAATYGWIFGLHVRPNDPVPRPQELHIFNFRECRVGPELGDVEIRVGFGGEDTVTWLQLAEVFEAIDLAAREPFNYSWYVGPMVPGSRIVVMKDRRREVTRVEMLGTVQGEGGNGTDVAGGSVAVE